MQWRTLQQEGFPRSKAQCVSRAVKGVCEKRTPNNHVTAHRPLSFRTIVFQALAVSVPQFCFFSLSSTSALIEVRFLFSGLAGQEPFFLVRCTHHCDGHKLTLRLNIFLLAGMNPPSSKDPMTGRQLLKSTILAFWLQLVIYIPAFFITFSRLTVCVLPLQRIIHAWQGQCDLLIQQFHVISWTWSDLVSVVQQPTTELPTSCLG